MKSRSKWSKFSNFMLPLQQNFKKQLDMKELIAKIQETYEAFAKDAALQSENGNKSAGTRARKASLSIEKMMKEFRKLSLEESKK